MSKVGGQRNFGYGKTLAWAGKNALNERYGNGHFATQAAHAARWRQFAEFANQQGIKDARQIDQALLNEYATNLKEKVSAGEMAVAYAQNLLSTANVVLTTLRGDNRVGVSPAKFVGQRSHVRQTPPDGMDKTALSSRLEYLLQHGEGRIAVVAELARHLGLRFREASLIDASEALRQADRLGRVNITQGTKGGRGKGKDRWVPMSTSARQVLERAAVDQAERPNLIPKGLNFRHWRDHAYAAWGHSAGTTGNKGFHSLRAAYACERYAEITGHAAPCISGHRAAPKALDRNAREILAQELGHGRTDIVAVYVGSAAR